MVEAPNFYDYDSFKVWLNNFDDETTLAYAQVLSGRVAPRVVPFLAEIWPTVTNYKIRSDLTLHSLRANLLSAVTRKYPSADNKQAADSAAVSAGHSAASTDSATDSALSAVFAAYSADSAARSAARSVAFSAAYNAADFAYTAALSADSAADFAAIWASLREDAQALLGGMDVDSMEKAPIWLTRMPKWFAEQQKVFSEKLTEDGPHWDFWLRWYVAKVAGEPVAGLSPQCEDYVVQWLASKEDDFWRTYKGEEDIKRIAQAIKTREMECELAKADDARTGSKEQLRKLFSQFTSPNYAFDAQGRINAVANEETDAPLADAELLELPHIQRGLIDAIKSMLEECQAPSSIIALFDSYRRELDMHGSNPVLGALDQYVRLLNVKRNKAFAGAWTMDEGIADSFDMFLENHAQIKTHYPLDHKRVAALDAAEMDVTAELKLGLVAAVDQYLVAVEQTGSDIATDYYRQMERDRLLAARDVLQTSLDVPDGVPVPADDEARKESIKKAQQKTVASSSGSADALLDKIEQVSRISDSAAGKALIEGAKAIAKAIWG